MTAFDNIKTNNWPATSNNLEDFLVLKMPLNDNASLTESLPVAVGSKELFPKRTLTNSQVRPKSAGVGIDDAATITGTPWSANDTFEYAFREGYDTYGDPQSARSAAFASNGGTYKIVFADGGYSVSQNIVLKFYINGGNLKVNEGETDEQEWTTTDGSAFQTWTIAASSVSQLKNIQLTNDTNMGPYLSGVYVDGVQLVNPALKKHYDNNAYFDSNAYLQLAAADSVFDLGTDDFCIEYFFKADNLSSAYKLFQLGTEINWTENIEMRMTTSGTINYDIYPGGSVATDNYGFTGTQTFTAGTWNHVAFTRQGSTFRGFLNGVADGSATYAGTISSPTPAHHRPTFGARTNGSVTTIQGPRLVGSIQDFRLYKGTAKYTSNFTPPGAILD